MISAEQGSLTGLLLGHTQLVLAADMSCRAAQLEHASCHSTFQLNRCRDATLQAVVLVTAFTSLPFPAAVTGLVAAAATVCFIDIQCK